MQATEEVKDCYKRAIVFPDVSVREFLGVCFVDFVGVARAGRRRGDEKIAWKIRTGIFRKKRPVVSKNGGKYSPQGRANVPERGSGYIFCLRFPGNASCKSDGGVSGKIR